MKVDHRARLESLIDSGKFKSKTALAKSLKISRSTLNRYLTGSKIPSAIGQKTNRRFVYYERRNPTPSKSSRETKGGKTYRDFSYELRRGATEEDIRALIRNTLTGSDPNSYFFVRLYWRAIFPEDMKLTNGSVMLSSFEDPDEGQVAEYEFQTAQVVTRIDSYDRAHARMLSENMFRVPKEYLGAMIRHRFSSLTVSIFQGMKT